jgi:hypothetical protein
MKTVKTEGQAQVVEYTERGELKRRIVPQGATNVKLGAPYGLPFAMLLKQHGMIKKMADRIERELHQRGIWTAEDLRQNPQAALGSIQAAYGVDLQTLFRLARRR